MQADMGDVYLIERVRRDAAGAVTHVSWCPRKPHAVCIEAEITEVIAAIHNGVQVNVMVGFIIGEGVQVSADGTTIVDRMNGHAQPFRLEHVPLM